MTEFAYRAASAHAPERGRIDAADALAARRALRDRGLVPLEIRPVAAGERLRAGFASKSALRAPDRVWFFRTLERFLSRGAPLEEGVAAAVDLASTPARTSAAERVLERLRQGDSLADACVAVPGLVATRHSAILRVGHASGRLARSVAIVADAYENAARLKKQIIGQMIYPVVVLVAAFICVWILAALVVPSIAEQLEAMDAELPAPTRITLAGTRVFVWAAPVLVLLIAGGVAAWRRGVVSPEQKSRVARAMWGVPLWRDLVWNARAAAAAETVATLLEGGGELLEGLDLAKDAMGDPVMEERLAAARARIREGADPASALADENVFPREPAAVLQIGSRAGDLAGGLDSAAQACAEQRDALAGRLTTLINPAVMLLMGAVVGWLFYSLLAGMLAINDAGTL